MQLKMLLLLLYNKGKTYKNQKDVDLMPALIRKTVDWFNGLYLDLFYFNDWDVLEVLLLRNTIEIARGMRIKLNHVKRVFD